MEKATQFFKESVQELKKVTRPGRKEILASSAVVLVVTLLFMVITLVEDWVVGQLVGLLFR